MKIPTSTSIRLLTKKYTIIFHVTIETSQLIQNHLSKHIRHLKKKSEIAGILALGCLLVVLQQSRFDNRLLAAEMTSRGLVKSPSVGRPSQQQRQPPRIPRLQISF